MKSETIEVAIDKYVQERMEQGRQKAAEHFLAYAYLKHGRGEIHDFMKKACGLSRYYIDFLKVMENPCKGPELAFLGTILSVAIYSCFLMRMADKRILGMMLFSGALVHLWYLLLLVAKKWRKIGVMIAIYREIAETACRQHEQECHTQ